MAEGFDAERGVQAAGRGFIAASRAWNAGLGDMLVDVVANMTTEAHPPCTGASRRASTSRERRTLANVPVCGLSRRTGMSPNVERNRPKRSEGPR